MDEKVLGFEEKLQKLLEEAKKKKNVLEEQEIQSFFADDHLDEDKWDAVYDFLDANKIRQRGGDRLRKGGSLRAGRRQCGRSGPDVFKRNW